MNRPTASLVAFIRKFWLGQAGLVDVFFVLFLTAMVGFMGLVVDFGRAYQVQQALQASTDAAALAGGYNIATSTAVATAKNYSSLTGDKNALTNSGVTVSIPGPYPLLSCLADQVTVIGACSGTEIAGGANIIKVEQQAVVPTYFTALFGVKSVTVTALSTASQKGGTGTSLNVIIILDTTASMGDEDDVCGATRESCALTGVQDLLEGLNPTIDKVGLMVFPGLGSLAEATDYSSCGKSLPNDDIQTYGNSPNYSIVGLASTFASKTGTLDTSDPLVIATGDGGCNGGIPTSPPGGVATYYAEAINAAQTALLAAAQPQVQNVIIFLSDGDANSTTAETDITGFIDNGKVVGTAGTTLTVSTCPNGCALSTTQDEGPLANGQLITGTGVAANTTIVKQLTGTTGGAGTYQVSVSQAVGTKNAVSMTAANMLTLDGKSFDQNTDECAQAVAAAQAAASAGTWVYSVSYGSATSGSCDTDSPATSACTTMTNIASDPTKFYSDDADGCKATVAGNNISNLIALFKALSTSLTEPRLLANSVT